MKKIIIGVFSAILIIAIVVIGCFTIPDLYCKAFHDASTHNEAIVSGYVDCDEDYNYGFGDSLCYAEYYYDNDITEELFYGYQPVADNLESVKKYLQYYNDRFYGENIYPAQTTGKGYFLENVSEDDYFILGLGGIPADNPNADYSTDNFELYLYDTQSKTIYYMQYVE